jgi:hypothetical protein
LLLPLGTQRAMGDLGDVVLDLDGPGLAAWLVTPAA